MNRQRLTVSAIYVTGILFVSLLTRPASATNSPQTVGAFMAFGGDTASAAYCLTANVFTDVISLSSCDESAFSSEEQQWSLYSDSTIHLDIGGSDYGCLDIYGDDPSGGVIDLNPGGTYPCDGNHADIWYYTNAGEIRSYYAEGYCLTASSTSTVDIVECDASQSQIWLPLEFTFTLVNSQVGTDDYCLDVAANSQETGTPLDDTACNGTSAQYFTFRPNPSPTTAPFQAELWSQNSNGSNACMVDADVNDCQGLVAARQETDC